MLRDSLTFWDYCNALLPPLLWAGVIFAFSAQSVLPGPDQVYADFIFKKSAHIFVYAVLYFLVWRGLVLLSTSSSLASTRNASNKASIQQTYLWLIPFAVCLLYAVGDEFHQYLTPYRYATLRDVCIDMVGAGIAFLRIYRYI